MPSPSGDNTKVFLFLQFPAQMLRMLTQQLKHKSPTQSKDLQCCCLLAQNIHNCVSSPAGSWCLFFEQRLLFALSWLVRLFFDNMQFCQSAPQKSTIMSSQKEIWLWLCSKTKSLRDTRKQDFALHLGLDCSSKTQSISADLWGELWMSKGACFLSVATPSLPQGLKWHGGGLIILHRIQPVAVTWPLSEARGLIQSQRRGQWLLPGWREKALSGDYAGGIGANQKCLLPAALQWNSQV